MSFDQLSDEQQSHQPIFFRCCRTPRGRTRPYEFDQAVIEATERQLQIDREQNQSRQRSRNTIFGGRPGSAGAALSPVRRKSRKRGGESIDGLLSGSQMARNPTLKQRTPSRSRTRLKKPKPSGSREMLQSKTSQPLLGENLRPRNNPYPSRRLSAMDLALPRNSRLSSFPDFSAIRGSELSIMAKSPWIIVRQMAEGSMTPSANFPPPLSPMYFSPPRSPYTEQVSEVATPTSQVSQFLRAGQTTKQATETFLELSLTNEPLPDQSIPELPFVAESPYVETFHQIDSPFREVLTPVEIYPNDFSADEPLPNEPLPLKKPSKDLLTGSILGSWTQQPHQRTVSHPMRRPAYPKRVDSKVAAKPARPPLVQSKSADSHASLRGGDRWDFSHRLRDMRSDIRALRAFARSSTPGTLTLPFVSPDIGEPPPIPPEYKNTTTQTSRPQTPKRKFSNTKAPSPLSQPDQAIDVPEIPTHSKNDSGVEADILPGPRVPPGDPDVSINRMRSKRMRGGPNVIDLTAADVIDPISNATLSSQFVTDGQEPRVVSIHPPRTAFIPPEIKAQPPTPTPVARWVHSIRPAESPDELNSDSSGTFFLSRHEGNYSGFHDSNSTLAQPRTESALDIDSIYDARERMSPDYHGPALRESQDVYLAPPRGRRDMSSESRGTSNFLSLSDTPRRPFSADSIMTWSTEASISMQSSGESMQCLPPTPASRTPAHRDSNIPTPLPIMPAPLQINQRNVSSPRQSKVAPAVTETAHQLRRSHERQNSDRPSHDDPIPQPRRSQEERATVNIDAIPIYGSTLPRHSPTKAPLIPARNSSRHDTLLNAPPLPPTHHLATSAPSRAPPSIPPPTPPPQHSPPKPPTQQQPLQTSQIPRPQSARHSHHQSQQHQHPHHRRTSTQKTTSPPPTSYSTRPNPLNLSHSRPTSSSSRKRTSSNLASSTFSLFPSTSLTPLSPPPPALSSPPPPPPPIPSTPPAATTALSSTSPQFKRRDLVMDLQRSASARRKRQIELEVEAELEMERRREENEAARAVVGRERGVRRSQVGIAF